MPLDPTTKQVAPPRSILVVEDEELLAEAIKIKLEQAGYRVLTARTVEQAWDYLQEIGPVETMWLDHYLPGRTGLELLQAIRQDPKFKDIAVYLVTNSIDPSIINTYLKYGIRQYYSKVVTRLEKIVSLIEAERQGYGPTVG